LVFAPATEGSGRGARLVRFLFKKGSRKVYNYSTSSNLWNDSWNLIENKALKKA